MKITDDIAEKLKASLAAGVSDDAMNGIKKAVDNIIDIIDGDVMYRLKDDLAYNLSAYTVDMAERAVTALLEGNEDEMRRYLSAREGYWTGRDKKHEVIHGKLFEQGCLALRKKIVEAHREVITSERILDLEDQVRSLVEQINKLTGEKAELYERFQREHRS